MGLFKLNGEAVIAIVFCLGLSGAFYLLWQHERDRIETEVIERIETESKEAADEAEEARDERGRCVSRPRCVWVFRSGRPGECRCSASDHR